MVKNPLACFKSYDVRGKLNEELDEKVAYKIGRAAAQTLKIDTGVVGYDARESSPMLAQAVIKGFQDAGVNVLEIGLAGTEEMYSAVTEFNAGVGIEITASHNPIEYNGMKIVKNSSQPLSEKEFLDIKLLAERNNFFDSKSVGLVIDKKQKARASYIDKILSFIDHRKLSPLKIVINSGNGAAGQVIDKLNEKLVFNGVKTEFVYLHHNPDSSFPNGIPNPLLEENRKSTSNLIKREKADFGVAFDGDFDRCFLFDELGNFIPSEYVVGFLAKVFLNKEIGATIIHDTRVIWNTQDVVNVCEGHAVTSRTGHAFVKSTMREEGAIYGGEMSAHHYFKDFAYCDSGMIPWLLIWEFLSQNKILLSELVSQRKRQFPSSGEINFKVSDAKNCMRLVKDFYSDIAQVIDDFDGLSMCFDDWRFNLRKSNTEPLVRLNIETRANKKLLQMKTKELTNFIVDT